jgi:RNA binding exosome subunit
VVSIQRIVRQVEINVFIHATEDRNSVVKAVRNLFPEGVDFPTYMESNLDGYFGDPITKLQFIVKNRRPATDVFENLVSNLSSLDYITLLDELSQRIDDTKNFYLRLDKQKAYQGKYILERHDAIHIKFSLIVPHKADPAEIVREYLEAKQI